MVTREQRMNEEAMKEVIAPFVVWIYRREEGARSLKVCSVMFLLSLICSAFNRIFNLITWD